MADRLFVIGGSGFVGGYWSQIAANSFDVVVGSRHSAANMPWTEIDVSNEASVDAAFAAVRPRFVTLLAAMSDIDRAEREPDLAERINVDGAVHVARQCARFGARMLYVSTDAVFDGSMGFYAEDERPSPLNWYGHTKATAESRIRQYATDWQIVRVSLVLGRAKSPGGNSYLDKVLGNLRAGKPIISPTYEYRNPIDVVSLCRFLAELTPNAAASGVFQIGASDKISRYDLARQIALRGGFDPSLVVAQLAPVPGRAPRGADDFLGTDQLRAVCRTPVPDCQQVLERAFTSLELAEPR